MFLTSLFNDEKQQTPSENWCLSETFFKQIKYLSGLKLFQASNFVAHPLYLG